MLVLVLQNHFCVIVQHSTVSLETVSLRSLSGICSSALLLVSLRIIAQIVVFIFGVRLFMVSAQDRRSDRLQVGESENRVPSGVVDKLTRFASSM